MVKKRYVILDALRGFAILGIILANFPEFSLWTFSDPSTWTGTDRITRALQTMFVDGKFYTLFSLLFGMGFSIQYLSVYPMGFAYAAGFCLLFDRRPEGRGWQLLAKPGRMACTNYLGQSVLGILLFYGIGLGLGNRVGLLATELIALGVYAFQIGFSALWLKYFKFGPVEWVWRMLTYGKWLPLRQKESV